MVEITAFKRIAVIRSQDYQRVIEPRLAPNIIEKLAEPGIDGPYRCLILGLL